MGFLPQRAAMAVRNLLFCLVRHRFFSDRASGRFAPLQYHSLRGLPPPYCQFIFKTLTGFTRLDRLGFHAAPLPSAPSPKSNCLVRRACHLRLSRSGCVGCLVLGRGVTGHGPDWPAAPGELGPPDRQKFGLRAELHSGILLDIALSDVSSSIHAPQRHFERQLVLACHTRRAQ